MLRKIPIVPRFVGTLAGGAVIATVVVFTLIYSTVLHMLDTAEQRELSSIFNNIKSSIAATGSEAQAMSALVAGMPQVQDAMAAGDREALAALFVPGFAQLKKDYGVRQFQFHTPPATSFLRVHKPAKFGDDLSGFRKTVVETNTSRKPITGLEVGRAGLGIRGMVPISKAGQHLGSVEFGMSFGQAFFDDYSKAHNVSLALHLDRDGSMAPFATTLGRESVLDDAGLRSVLHGDSRIVQDEINGKPVSVYADVITNYSGEPIGVLQVAKDRTFYIEQLSLIKKIMWAMGIIGVLGGSLLIWLISQNVVRPLKSTARSMREIAEGDGDLTVALPEDGKDEVTELSHGFNLFVRTVQNLVREVSGAVKEVGSAAEGLASTAEHTSAAIRQQQEDSTQIATAMTEMSATVHEVAQNTVSAARAADLAEQQARDGQHVVTEAVDSIKRLSGEVQSASEIVKRVDDDTGRIGTVLDVIRGIAEQTNLLALNAAIEAARAGEQGRGFAVVADEVRELAKRTQESTQEINDMISSLRSSVNDTVAVMDQSRNQAAESEARAEAVREVLNQITESMDTISAMSNQIATAAEQQSHVAEDINQNVVNISRASEQTAQDAINNSESSKALALHAEQLVSLVGRFKTD